MRDITGHIDGLYNLIVDNENDIKILFSDDLNIDKNDINIKLRRTDLSAQIIVNCENIKKKCDTKIIFIVNRLDEFETNKSIFNVIYFLKKFLKIKDRNKKINKIKNETFKKI